MPLQTPPRLAVCFQSSSFLVLLLLPHRVLSIVPSRSSLYRFGSGRRRQGVLPSRSNGVDADSVRICRLIRGCCKLAGRKRSYDFPRWIVPHAVSVNISKVCTFDFWGTFIDHSKGIWLSLLRTILLTILCCWNPVSPIPQTLPPS